MSCPFKKTEIVEEPKTGLDAATIAIIKATAPVVAQHAREITNEFYGTLFINYPATKNFFNMANQAKGKQPQALANSIIAYASNIENTGALVGALDLIAFKHCGLQVLPAHYQIVHDNLMVAIGKILGSAVTPEIGAAWSKAVMELAGILINLEESMYKAAEARSGGFRGWKDFTVAKITTVSHHVKTFRLTASDASLSSFDFTPGQFLTVTVKVDPTKDFAPRHYTITSNPGDDFLEFSAKRIEGGVVSSYLHDVLVEGSTISVSPPFGGFRVQDEVVLESESLGGAAGPVVLLSAGIGMTPMKVFLQQVGERCVQAVHLDKTQQDVPFLQFFETNNAGKNEFVYTADGHRPDASALAAATATRVGDARTSYYICGPPDFMKDVAAGLRSAGVETGKIHWEAFGPQLSCPM